MSELSSTRNQVKEWRVRRGWTQVDLAQRAGISRAAVSAIEINRLVPSVAAALSLAAAFECRVEDLFGFPANDSDAPAWAWSPLRDPCRFWQARVGGRTLLYPIEPTPDGVLEHDGLVRDGVCTFSSNRSPDETLVVACCDPAASVLVNQFTHESGFRMLVLSRSSGEALELLKQRLIHVAGVHLAAADDRTGNAPSVKERVGTGMKLLRVATWEEGLALADSVKMRSVRALTKSRLSWIGREAGSGARKCLDQISHGRVTPRRLAHDHRGVAEAIRSGWADVGVCHRLTCEDAGLRFLSVRQELYDLCYAARDQNDPRIRSLASAVRSASYRRILGELPGYETSQAGTVEQV